MLAVIAFGSCVAAAPSVALLGVRERERVRVRVRGGGGSGQQKAYPCLNTSAARGWSSRHQRARPPQNGIAVAMYIPVCCGEPERRTDVCPA